MSQRAIIYARVSTDEQAERGYGLDYQIEQCKDYAAQRGYYVVGTATDDYSGATAIRPGIADLFNLIPPLQAQVVIIHRTDRLGRKARVQDALEAELEARGVQVEYVTAQFDDTPHGRFIRRISGAVNELDYELIVDRLKEHKVQKVKYGSIIATRPPYGYRSVVSRDSNGKRVTQLQINEDEAKVVRLIYQWYVYGDETGQALSIKGIAKKLAAIGAPRRNQNSQGRNVWATTTIFDILRRETYIGKWYYNRTVVVRDATTNKARQVARPSDERIMVKVPPIVGEEVYQLAQERGQRNLEQAKRNRKRLYLFSGMMRCATCRQRFAGLSHAGKASYKFYRCGLRSHQKWGTGCPDVDYKESEIDRVVWDWLSDLVTHPEQIEAALHQRQADAEAQNTRLYEHLRTTEQIIEQKRAEQSNLIRLYAKNPLPALEAEIEHFEREIADHEQEYARMEARLAKITYSPEQIASIKDLCAQIAHGLSCFTLEEKRQTYQLLDFSALLTVEDGWQVAYVECIIDLKQQRLLIKQVAPSGGSTYGDHDVNASQSEIAFGLSRLAVQPVRSRFRRTSPSWLPKTHALAATMGTANGSVFARPRPSRGTASASRGRCWIASICMWKCHA